MRLETLKNLSEKKLKEYEEIIENSKKRSYKNNI